MAWFGTARAVIMHTCILSLFLSTTYGATALVPGVELCTQLGSIFNASICVAGEAEYQSLRTENWSETAWRHPTCVFQPASADELRVAVPLIAEAGVKFAIRSGGHSPAPNGSNIDNGILIDLSRLDNIDYNADLNIVTFGSGLRWVDVYSRLDQYGVTVVGGRVVDVGVGGLTLGSGLSYLSDLHGLVCDNVVDYEVVISNGSIIHANASHHLDLFWALKGGGNNFGIVTRFSLSTYPIGQVWGGIRRYELGDLEAVLLAMAEYQAAPNKDPYVNAFVQGFVTNETIGVALTLINLKPQENPAAFEPFSHLSPVSDSITILPFSEFLQGQGAGGLKRIDWSTTSFVPSASIYKELGRILVESSATKKIQSTVAGTVIFGLQPISESLVRAGHARGGNALGLQAVNQTWLVIDSAWFYESDDALVHNAAAGLIDAVKASIEPDSRLPYLFMNDASWDQPVISSYGAENVRRLQRVAEIYDPGRVFQSLVPGGFKLPPLA